MSTSAGDGPWTSALHAARVRDVIVRARFLTGVHPVSEVDSTQDLAAALGASGAPGGTVVVADRQRAGRGRSGRTWDDRPEGGSLALTVLLDIGEQVPREDPLTMGIVPHALGLAVLRGCERAVPGCRDLALKWPNDVVHRRHPSAPARKVSGVLVEREQVLTPGGPREVLLCGIGINVDLGDSRGRDRACLRELFGRVPDRAELIAELLEALDGSIARSFDEPEALMADYRAVSDTVGRRIRVETVGRPPQIGVAEDVDDSGQLIMTTDAGRRAILSGTVRDADDQSGAVS